MLLDDKVAIVTGASRGIGAATARLMARQGACVTVNYLRNEGAARRLVDEIRGEGGRAIAVAADVRDRDAVDRMVDSTVTAFGGVDILVNNAVRDVSKQRIEDVSWEDFEDHFRSVVGGAVNCVQATLPHMLSAGGGVIINVGTTALITLSGELSPYVTAKGALLGFTRSLADELAPRGIRVNMVAPGMTWRGSGEPPRGWEEEHRRRTPAGRNARPDDIAGVVCLLASDMAGFVTGTLVPVSGGMVMAG